MEPLATEKKELQPVLEVLKSFQTTGFLNIICLIQLFIHGTFQHNPNFFRGQSFFITCLDCQ